MQSAFSEVNPQQSTDNIWINLSKHVNNSIQFIGKDDFVDIMNNCFQISLLVVRG